MVAEDLPGFLGAQPDLMIPGPGPLTDEARRILGSPLLPHYGATWPGLHAEVVHAVGRVLGCSSGPYLLPGSGTAAVDAALFGVFRPGQRVVVPATGYFGDRLADMSRAHGLDVVEVPVPVGEPAGVDAVAAALDGADGLVTVHVETSTGVRHPVADLAAAATAAGAAVVVDAVASAGGEVVDVDGWPVDAVVTASQKGLAGPPGVGIVALSPRGRERVLGRDDPCPSWYLDLRRWDRHREEDAWEPHPVTMPTTALLAVLAGARRILAGGVDRWVADRAALAERCREGLAERGYPPVPADGCGANLVVAAWCDDPGALADQVAERAGVTIGRGLGPTEGRAVRVGLMGAAATDEAVDRVLAALA